MGMHEETLTSAWYEITDLDDPLQVLVAIVGDDCQFAFEVAEPTSTATSAAIAEGITYIDIPFGKSMWIKCPSGSATVTYSQYGGLLFDSTKSLYGFTDFGAMDYGIEVSPLVESGSDDLTTRTGDNPYSFIGFLQSLPAGIAAAATIDFARLQLQLTQRVAGEVLRVYGIESATGVTIGDYMDLASGLTLTSAYTEFTVGSDDLIGFSIDSILTELVGVLGWTTASPIQLWIAAPGTATPGVDARIQIASASRNTALFIGAS
jgi:hypothetical protein